MALKASWPGYGQLADLLSGANFPTSFGQDWTDGAIPPPIPIRPDELTYTCPRLKIDGGLPATMNPVQTLSEKPKTQTPKAVEN